MQVIIPENLDLTNCPVNHVLLQDMMARYNFSLSFVRGSVLDMGCGCGLGSYLISFKAGRVDAVDASETSIKAASIMFGANRISYVHSDFYSFLGQRKAYDTVICFECLEHLDDISRAIDLVAQNLSTNGVALFSLPVNDPPNEFHKYRFSGYQDVLPLFDGFEFTRLFFQSGHNVYDNIEHIDQSRFYQVIIAGSHQNVLKKHFTTLADLSARIR